jgi:hypothetical protein
MSISTLFAPNTYQLYVGGITFGSSGTPFNTYNGIGYTTTVIGAISPSVPTIGLFRQISGTCTFSVVGITGTFGGSDAPIILATRVPILPFADTNFPVTVTDGGTRVDGTLNIAIDGEIKLFVGFNTNFTNAGDCGFDTFSVTYCSYT